MMALMRSEWKKVSGNRLLVSCVIWIWPFIVVALAGFTLVLFLANPEARAEYAATPVSWTDAALTPWGFLNNSIGRLLLMGFVAAVVAGEYEYRTWKTILPGNRRWVLLLVKYATIAGFIIMAFSVTMVIAVIVFGLMNLALGAGYPPEIGGKMLLDFAGDLALNISLSFVAVWIVASVAILVSIWTRSILFGVLVGVFISLLESLGIPLALALVSELLHLDWIGDAVVVTPTYHADNIAAWVNTGAGVSYPYLEDMRITASLAGSIVSLAVWLLGLMGLSVFFFERQDIQ